MTRTSQRHWYAVRFVCPCPLQSAHSGKEHTEERVYIIEHRSTDDAREAVRKAVPKATIISSYKLDRQITKMFHLMLDLMDDRIKASDKIAAAVLEKAVRP